MLLLHFLRELSQDDAMDKDDAIRLLKSLILIQKLIMFAATAVAPEMGMGSSTKTVCTVTFFGSLL